MPTHRNVSMFFTTDFPNHTDRKWRKWVASAIFPNARVQISYSCNYMHNTNYSSSLYEYL